MESCNDNFWYAKKLSGKFLHLCDSLYVHTYTRFIHIIWKSLVLKSEYLNPTRLGLIEVKQVGTGCQSFWGRMERAWTYFYQFFIFLPLKLIYSYITD